MKTPLLQFLLSLITFGAIAQNTPTTLAEWQQKLRTAKSDTAKLRCYGGILEIPLHDDTVLVYVKKAEQLGKKYPNHPTNINIFTRYGSIFRAKNMSDSAKYFYDKALNLALKIQNKQYLKFADFYRTYAIKSLANKINHLYHVLNSYQYDNNNTFDRSLQYQIYNHLIHNYLTFGNISKAKSLLNIAKPYMTTLQDSVKYYNVFTRTIALDAENTYESRKSQPKALPSETFKAMYADLTSFTEKNNLPNLRVEPLNSYGKILFYEKKYNEAISKAQELLNHAQKYKYPLAMNLGNMLLTESYIELGQYQKALSFLEKTTSNNHVQNYKRLYLFSKIYQEMGDSSKAYKYLLEATKEEEQVKGVKEQLLSAEIENQMELNKKQKEIAAKEFENKLKEERLNTEQQERIALKLSSELALSAKEKEIHLQKKEITAQELENKFKEERIKAEQQQKTVVIALLLLSLGLLAWAVWSYRKQRQLRHLLELQNHSLESKTKELTDANQTKDKIFSVLGHDLQNPINELKAILMLFDIQSITPAKIKDLILPLSHKIETVQAMLSNLLQWSVLELNQQSSNRYTVSFKEIVEKVIRQLDNNAQRKQIQITTHLQPIEATVNAEEMEIVLRNLLSNAIKFTPNNGSIWIEGVENQQTISIKIKDTGIGLPNEVIEHTTPYPTSRKGTAGEKGTGIGLKISRELVEKNDGIFTFENNLPTGTIISLVFKKSA
jgi:signal transduction histidine kinase